MKKFEFFIVSCMYFFGIFVGLFVLMEVYDCVVKFFMESFINLLDDLVNGCYFF